MALWPGDAEPKPSWLQSLPSGLWRVHTPAGHADIYPAPEDLRILERNASLLAETAESLPDVGEVLTYRIAAFVDELLVRCVADWKLTGMDGNPLRFMGEMESYEERLDVQRLVDEATSGRLLDAWLWLAAR